jgi:hypothetical protein
MPQNSRINLGTSSKGALSSGVPSLRGFAKQSYPKKFSKFYEIASQSLAMTNKNPFKHLQLTENTFLSVPPCGAYCARL